MIIFLIQMDLMDILVEPALIAAAAVITKELMRTKVVDGTNLAAAPVDINTIIQ
jgi:hypothetical protein